MRSLFSEPPPLAPEDVPQGFKFASAACGLKRSKRPDLALIASENDTATAAVFTTNRVQAAPVLVSREHLRISGGNIRAVIVNSGNANCATGAAGLAASRATTASVARELDCRAEQVLVCSTGVIGLALDTKKLLGGLPGLARAAENSPAAVAGAAEAILTTDTRRKWATATCRVGDVPVRLLGFAKGSGMINPHMATMLAFVMTDAVLTRPLAHRALAAVTRRTFNCVTVDGDTSTNDTLIFMANGAAGAPIIRTAENDYDRFLKAFESVCQELALSLVADGEGATRVAEIEVRGVPTDEIANQLVRAIANSPLVKTALAGADPNWGRILCAAGYAPLRNRATFDLAHPDIRIAGVTVCRAGQACAFDESAVHQKMLAEQVPIIVDFKKGIGQAAVWTCDFTAEYVRINASYRS
ncbi:MAG TPA: bifunctional glutamate N-acetyltransferase/amino-acid acetyltransferase ArgJ [Terriglobia bacterium]|nr:bifunctional glutamate N-acetyltransferase/amino-acid acetyltransferase ArgJ [Terriglobia bacterium]